MRFPRSDQTDGTNDTSNILEEVFTTLDWRQFYQPTTLKEISEKQKEDQYLHSLQEKAPDRLGLFFEDIGKKTGPDTVVTEKDGVDGRERIFVPKSVVPKLLQWYHTILVHPGLD